MKKKKIDSTSNNSKNSKPKEYWGEVPVLTTEQTIQWLDGFRELMFEVWRNNPNSIPREKKISLKDWLKK
jgi:hypothetical protein